MNKKIKFKIITALSVVLFSSVALAAILESEWENDMYKYCKYSDGTVIKIGLVSLCPLTI
jgi:hypothetical protein